MIGGQGEQKTLRLVAQYADACNFFGRMGEEAIRHKLQVLQDWCEKVGRPYTEIEKTTLDHLRLSRDGREGTMSPQQALDHFAELAALGIDQAIFSLPNPTDPEVFDLIAGEIAPAASQIAVAGR
jgi:hypothetical protein